MRSLRIVFDATGSPESSGGMNLYAREVIRAWSEAFPRDDVCVVADRWAASVYSDLPNVRVVTVRSRNVIARFLAQTFVVAAVYFRLRADLLVSLSSIVSPLVRAQRRAVVIHDWRHKTRADEFGTGQRIYRRLWEYSITRAGLTVAISEKTSVETRRWADPRRMVVIANGGDHPRRWEVHEPTPGAPITITTFGHFRNKRPELAIEALALVRTGGVQARLTILGAKGPYRDELLRLADEQRVREYVDAPGFVDDAEYERIIQSSTVLSLLSSDEGYGLPVVEANYFGLPVVVTTDSGLGDIHGDRVVAVAPSAPAIAEAFVEAIALRAQRPGSPSPVRSWADCVIEMRSALVDSLDLARTRS